MTTPDGAVESTKLTAGMLLDFRPDRPPAPLSLAPGESYEIRHGREPVGFIAYTLTPDAKSINGYQLALHGSPDQLLLLTYSAPFSLEPHLPALHAIADGYAAALVDGHEH